MTTATYTSSDGRAFDVEVIHEWGEMSEVNAIGCYPFFAGASHATVKTDSLSNRRDEPAAKLEREFDNAVETWTEYFDACESGEPGYVLAALHDKAEKALLSYEITSIFSETMTAEQEADFGRYL